MKPRSKAKGGRKGTVRNPRASGKLFELRVDRLTWGGRGLGRRGGKVVFVPKTVPGDRLLVRPEKVRASFTEGRVAGLLAPGADRVDPRCPWFSQCGGCQWLAVDYARQVLEKGLMLQAALRRHLEGATLEPLVRATPPLAYRHRGDFHARPAPSGVHIGFYEEGSHRLVDISGCLLFDKVFGAQMERLRNLLAALPEARGLERMTLARSETESAFSAHFRLGPESAPQAPEALLAKMAPAGLGGAVVTTGKGRGPGELVRGVPFIWFGVPAEGGDLRLRAEVRSFTQAHFAMNRRMVSEAMAWLGLSPRERVLDLYAGVGNFSLPAARLCREVVALEDSPQAHADAVFNAGANEIPNVVHLEEDAVRGAARLADEGERFDAVLLDPPRAGALAALGHLARLEPRRILYVSCNLPSLERDLGELGRLGYRLVRVQGWDLFPQTYGVETLCLLEKTAGREAMGLDSGAVSR